MRWARAWEAFGTQHSVAQSMGGIFSYKSGVDGALQGFNWIGYLEIIRKSIMACSSLRLLRSMNFMTNCLHFTDEAASLHNLGVVMNLLSFHGE